MQAQNLTEYELVRTEMTCVKDCMTNYIGFVLGGSGLALFGVISLGMFTKNLLGLAYVSIFLSTLISLVLMILFYKFNSHNRFAGYCKLLNHERFEGGIDTPDVEYVSWELCLERLRRSDMDSELIGRLVKDIKVNDLEKKPLKALIKKYQGDRPEVDKRKCWEGMKKLVKAFCGRSSTSSWGFPPFVASIFFVLCYGFLILGIISVFRYVAGLERHSFESGALIGVTVCITAGQMFLWIMFCGRLQTLLSGSTTVDGFFWRFLPIRVAFLNKYNIIPKYEFAGERLGEEVGVDAGATPDTPFDVGSAGIVILLWVIGAAAIVFGVFEFINAVRGIYASAMYGAIIEMIVAAMLVFLGIACIIIANRGYGRRLRAAVGIISLLIGLALITIVMLSGYEFSKILFVSFSLYVIGSGLLMFMTSRG